MVIEHQPLTDWSSTLGKFYLGNGRERTQMTRASFECRVTGEQCSEPECSVTFCKLEGRIAMEDEGHQRQYEYKLFRSGKVYAWLEETGLIKKTRIKRRF